MRINPYVKDILDPVGSRRMVDKHKELIQTLRDKATIISDANDLPDEDMIEWQAAYVIEAQAAQIGRLTCEVTSLRALLEDERRKSEEIIAEYVKETT